MTKFDIHERISRLPKPEVRRALRLANGLTLQDIADAVGVSVPAVWRWEQGLREPRLHNRLNYERVLLRLRQELGDA